MMPISPTASAPAGQMGNGAVQRSFNKQEVDAYEAASGPAAYARKPAPADPDVPVVVNPRFCGLIAKAAQALKAMALGILGLLAGLPRGLYALIKGPPSPASCYQDISDLRRNMMHMQWPTRDLLTRYSDVFAAELDLFELRLKEIQNKADRCPNDVSLSNRLYQLRREFSDLVCRVVMQWPEQTLAYAADDVELMLKEVTDFEGTFRLVGGVLARCMLVVTAADKLRSKAPHLSDKTRSDLGAKLQEIKCGIPKALGAQRDRLGGALREDLWDAACALRTMDPSQRLERGARLRQTVAQSIALYERDKEILFQEIDAQLQRGAS